MENNVLENDVINNKPNIVETQKKVSIPNSEKPCYAYFKTRNCLKGDKCKFNHDEEKYLKERELKHCPNKCGNFCRLTSNKCASCFEKIYIEREKNRQLEIDNREEKKCLGYNCTKMTKFRFCKQCNEVNKQYIR
jgi:hypothetical protein